jgi:hypothetical protein
MNDRKKKYNKVIKELIEYIEWNNSSVDLTNLNINPPLIWDIYYEKYKYNFHKVKLSNVFIKKSSNIVKIDFQTIYKCYLKDSFYKQFIQPDIEDITIENDVIINMKYELILKINMIEPIKIHILNYLIV